MNDEFTAILAGIFFVVVVIVIVFVGVSITEHTDPLTGKVTKVWSEHFGDYAVVETSDGKRVSVEVKSRDYGLLDVGLTCTFQVKHNQEATAVTCEASR